MTGPPELRPAGKPPARILFIEPVAERGGAEVVLLGVLKHLDRTRFEPHVALLSDGPLVAELSGLATVHVFPKHRVRQLAATLSAIRGLCALVKKAGIDVLHTQGTKTHLYGGAVRALTGVPELWHVYDPPPPRPGWLDRVVTRVPTDALVFISEAPLDAFGSLMDTEGAEVVYPGIDAPAPPAPGVLQGVLDRLGIKPDAPLILQVSRLQAFKGHTTLIDAVADLTRFQDLQVVMAGATLFGLEEDYPALVRARIERAGLSARVHLVGWLSDAELSALFHHAACLCYAELVGPYSLVILEAMAAGRPVVASRTAGSELLVEDGRTGHLVPAGDARAMAGALARILGDPKGAARLGEAGRERQAARFTGAAMTRRIEAVHQRLLANQGAR